MIYLKLMNNTFIIHVPQYDSHLIIKNSQKKIKKNVKLYTCIHKCLKSKKNLQCK